MYSLSSHSLHAVILISSGRTVTGDWPMRMNLHAQCSSLIMMRGAVSVLITCQALIVNVDAYLMLSARVLLAFEDLK